MHGNITIMAKQAVREALQANWDKAVEINSQILEADPKNIEAKLRLGHAFIQTKHLIKAKKIFTDVLDADPINPVALKNLSLINKKVEVISPVKANAGALIKEPGTTAEAEVKLTARGVTAESFASGETLVLKAKRTSVEVYRIKKDKEVLVGEIDNPEVVKCLNKALKEKADTIAKFVKGTDRNAEILLKCTIPIFKSEKQDVRPYIKKGTFEDGETEEEETEVEITE
jgi:hypothetical protein